MDRTPIALARHSVALRFLLRDGKLWTFIGKVEEAGAGQNIELWQRKALQ